MSGALSALLGVVLLADPEAAERIEIAAEVVELEDEDQAAKVLENKKEAEKLVISSERGDFDREEGVVLFDGHAAVDYSADYHMRADRLFAYFVASNELDRIEAYGNVAITNGSRIGACGAAVFRRRAGEVEMFAAPGGGTPARLCERGGNDIAGRRIKFWIDGEQVEIEDSEISFSKGSRKIKGKGIHGRTGR